MGAREPLLDAVRSLPETPDESAAEAAGADDAAWLERIVSLIGGRDPTRPASLDALLAGHAAGGAGPLPATSLIVALDRLRLDGVQARRGCDDEKTAQLAASIARQGVLQPLVVRPAPDAGDYLIVAGARRYHAARRAGLGEVPVVAFALSDREALMVALVENLQREDLGAIDEAQCYFRLLDEFAWTQEELAQRVGRSRSHIGNTLRLLGLPAPVRALLDKGALTAGHARALLNAAAPEELAEHVVAHDLTVRETEALARRRQQAARPTNRSLHRATSDLEDALARRLGLAVRLRQTRRGGRITIYYGSADELDAALRAYGRAGSPPAPAAAAHPAHFEALPA